MFVRNVQNEMYMSYRSYLFNKNLLVLLKMINNNNRNKQNSLRMYSGNIKRQIRIRYLARFVTVSQVKKERELRLFLVDHLSFSETVTLWLYLKNLYINFSFDSFKIEQCIALGFGGLLVSRRLFKRPRITTFFIK